MAKVLIVASLASSLMRFRGDLIRSLVGAGHEIRALAPDPDAETVSELASHGVKCVATDLSRAGINPAADIRYMLTLRHHITRYRPDLVLAYTPKPVIYSGLACRGVDGVRHYALISGLGYGFGRETLRQRLLTPLLVRLFRHGLSKSSTVIFQNPDDRQVFLTHGIVSNERTCIVDGSGVDPDRFRVVPLPEPPTFLLMARLIPEKGVREYIAAARQLRQWLPHARFLLAGWLEARRGAISAAEVESWCREGVIEYLGVLDDVRPAIAQASVYVLPSYYREGIPRSVLEAMSMGRAIITTDMPGCRETVLDGDNGLLVRPRNVQMLMRSMERLAGDPACVAKMGRASRRRIEQRFAVDRVNEQMMTAMGLRA